MSQVWDWLTGQGQYRGLTDAEYAKKQKDEKAARDASTAKQLAAWRQADTQRLQKAAENKAANEEYNKAVNTRVDRLTERQKQLISRGPSPEVDKFFTKEALAKLNKEIAEYPTGKKRTHSGGDKPTPTKAKSTAEEAPPKQTEVKNNLFNSTNADQKFSSDRKYNNSFNINRFRAEVTNADSILPTHSFLVVFSPFKTQITDATTREIREEALTISQRVTMRCDNVILPNLGLLQEQNIRRYGYGTTENVAYGINTGDVTMQFVVDNKSEILHFFEKWFDTVVNRDSKGGADMRTENDKKYAPYEVGYKDDYSCPVINVFVYDRSNNAVFEYNIYDAFPINLQSINLSWADENTLMKLNVSFAFTDFKINTPKVSTAEEKLNVLRKESSSALEERMTREDMDYQASVQRGIQEKVSSLPGVTFGPETLPTTISAPSVNTDTPASTTQITSPGTVKDTFGNPIVIS